VYIGETGWSTEMQHKEHVRHLHLSHADKFQETEILAKTSGYRPTCQRGNRYKNKI
jgi:hypothetical protein